VGRRSATEGTEITEEEAIDIFNSVISVPSVADAGFTLEL
jgi:hypothetical protein